MNFDLVAIISRARAAGWAQAFASEIESALISHDVRSQHVDTDDLPRSARRMPTSKTQRLISTSPDEQETLAVLFLHACWHAVECLRGLTIPGAEMDKLFIAAQETAAPLNRYEQKKVRTAVRITS
jgi:hypothetical protein